MAVNIIEKPILPVVDMENKVVTYLLGYAIKGPYEPTYIDSETLFIDTFGDSAYQFKTDQVGDTINTALKNSKERSYLMAREIVKRGGKIIYHRYEPIGTNLMSKKETTTGVVKIVKKVTTENGEGESTTTPVDAYSFNIRARYGGMSYNNTKVIFTPNIDNPSIITIEIKDSSNILLETAIVSLNPNSLNYIFNTSFKNVIFYTGNYADPTYSTNLNLAVELQDNELTENEVITIDTVEHKLTCTHPSTEDEFKLSDFEAAIPSMLEVMNDSNLYPDVTYITTGAYFQDKDIAKKLLEVSRNIKAMAPIDFGKGDNDSKAILDTIKGVDFEFGYMDLGADTYEFGRDKYVVPSYFGGILAQLNNMLKGIPHWLPIANNVQGSIPANDSTLNITKADQQRMISSVGHSINPIVYKRNVGYVLMGNRTLYKNAGILSPQSFKNCRYVLNMVERTASRVAESLTISSTNANETFQKFLLGVEPTITKLLVNGDGIHSYYIKKLKKTQVATLDIAINLVLVEGIEVFNITIPYSLNFD